MYEFLKKVPLFANLTDDDLDNLCQDAKEIDLPMGTELFAEGSDGNRAFVIQSGELDIVKVAHGQEVLLAIRREGEVIGEMALLQDAPRMAGARARSDVQLLSIGFGQLDNLLDTNPAAARTMLQTITSRWRATQTMLRQSEKMAQLGSLAAGMAHELNNPATAALRGAEQLQQTIDQIQSTFLDLNSVGLSNEQVDILIQLSTEIQTTAASPDSLDALSRSDQESEQEEWLESNKINNGWEVAPNLVSSKFDLPELEKLKAQFADFQLGNVVVWISNTYSVFSIVEEIGQGAERITELVNALKSYSYLDQAPTQAVDVHEGINNTLVLLRNKLKKAVNVERQFDESLPKINAYGSELNQVWTNLIDNAVDAMNEKGTLTIKTEHDSKWVTVTITDSGEGIPDEIQKKIFDPYFTTKPPGKGTGLGLDISRKIITDKHMGEISLKSKPGETSFIIKLPLNFEDVH
ncbi:MAG: ATP-binding protein [Chloroflexota bacterium]